MSYNPDEAPMPGAWVTSEEQEEAIPGWNSEQKKLLPDEEPEGPYEHPEVPDVFQYVYKQSLVSYFERINLSAKPTRGSIIPDKDIFLREEAIDYNDHEPLTVINNGAVIRTSKAALQKSRMDRLQEDRDYDERERGSFRGRGGRGRGRGRGRGGFSRSGRDEGGNANEIVLGERRPRTSSSSSRARSRSPLLPRRDREASHDRRGGWARPRSPPRPDREHRSREESRSSRHESSGSDIWERREAWGETRDRRSSFEPDRRDSYRGDRNRRESYDGDRRQSYGDRGEKRRESFGEQRKTSSGEVFSEERRMSLGGGGERKESIGDRRQSYGGDRRESYEERTGLHRGEQRRESFSGQRKGSYAVVSEERRKSFGGGGERRESIGDRRDSTGRDDRKISLGGLRESLGVKDKRDSCGGGEVDSRGRAGDRPGAPAAGDPRGRDSSSHSNHGTRPGSQVMAPSVASPATSTSSGTKISYAEYKKRKEMERQRGSAAC